MKIQTGVWLDKKKAIIVNLLNNEPSIEYVESDIAWREREPGEKKKFGRFGDQYLSMEAPKRNKLKQQVNSYMKRIIEELRKSDEIMIFGPAEMKKELEKTLLNTHEMGGKIVGTVTAESMTENQFVALVKEHFSD